jgi:acetyl-CoA C-acetyltransferase
MSEKREIVVVSGVRTAIGDYGGSLKDFAPTDLAARAAKEAVARAGIDAAEVGHVVFGNIIHTEPKDMYLSRVAMINAGIPKETPALTLNRLCGSGFQSIITASNAIQLGDADVALAGGAESMSRALYSTAAMRWGARMADTKLIDMMVGSLTDPFDTVHMGVTAENVAARHGITRGDQDAFAVESHKRAAAAIAAGHFKDQILPIEIQSKKGVVVVDKDEHVRGDVTVEGLGKLKPAFKKDGTVTPGNASGINDAAAAVVLMDAKVAERKGLKPLARFVAYAYAGVEPAYMGEGPIPAVRNVLQRAGLKLDDMDVIEANEAFAAQALAVSKNLGFDPARVNPNGGAVALGHPIGATGTIITIKALYELKRTGKKYALITMCIGGGQGIAGIFERL